jgi:hypothetical protein
MAHQRGAAGEHADLFMQIIEMVLMHSVWTAL